MDTDVTPEQKTSSAKLMIQKGIATGFPIMLGYLPISITYGVLAKQSGMTMLELALMSVMVFAGASQLMAANMIAVSAGAAEIIVATFVLNFRQFVMSLSFMNRLRNFTLKWKVPLSMGLTDETFAVSSLHTEKADMKKGGYFYAGLILTAYAAWVFGSILGGLLGEVIPEQLSQSMGIALYAMFIGLLIPSVKKEWRIGLVAILAMLINAICSQFMSEGWAIVCGTVLGGLSGVVLLKEDSA
ncbi:AzlC family ABC transporter permease [Barrientosiimonas marina]|uniref:AzlC family ABC transporter permease n=1 Tax=Lentibacillus kimchii TaxID=1542911 RepID=A0ABW2USK7_9BACI